ncbi:MAG: HepT-like ribonuclease domain-containing protein [Nitrospirota bacterium]
MDRFDKLFGFMEDAINYFLTKIEGVDRDRYFANRDIRNILDKTINDIILCVVDISEEVLKKQGRSIPDTYKDTILACHEFVGDIVFKVAPLVKHRNEAIHQYLKINWQNIVTIKNSLPDIRKFIDKAKKVMKL